MQKGTPSKTAYRVALRRAVHQTSDSPLVFNDPLARKILGPGHAVDADLRAPSRPFSRSLRAFLVARSAFAEDTLHAAVARGLQQYVLLGAGLDTFAYRNPYSSLRVFEVDHPDTQAWKLRLLQQADIAVPRGVAHVPVSFEDDTLQHGLHAAGFDRSQPAVIAWLGVVPYLTDAGFSATMHFLSTFAPGSELVLDYGLPRSSLPPVEQLMFDSLAARVAAAGEPFQIFFTPQEMAGRMALHNFAVAEDLDRDAINARYFAGRSDGLQVLGSAGHLLRAVRSA